MTLKSWNNTQPKQAILDFVAAASDENSPDYIPPAERIAAFDNDGTGGLSRLAMRGIAADSRATLYGP